MTSVSRVTGFPHLPTDGTTGQLDQQVPSPCLSSCLISHSVLRPVLFDTLDASCSVLGLSGGSHDYMAPPSPSHNWTALFSVVVGGSE